MKKMSCTLVALSVMTALYGVARSDNSGDAPPTRPAQGPTGPVPEAAPAAAQERPFKVHTFSCPPSVKLGVRDVVIEKTWQAEPSWGVGKLISAHIEAYGSPRWGWPRCDYKYTDQGIAQPGAAIHLWTNPAGIAGIGTYCQKAGSLSFKCAKHGPDGTW
jgi:hypothetical protein